LRAARRAPPGGRWRLWPRRAVRPQPGLASIASGVKRGDPSRKSFTSKLDVLALQVRYGPPAEPVAKPSWNGRYLCIGVVDCVVSARLGVLFFLGLEAVGPCRRIVDKLCEHYGPSRRQRPPPTTSAASRGGHAGSTSRARKPRLCPLAGSRPRSVSCGYSTSRHSRRLIGRYLEILVEIVAL
jgi:hypothetical protein